MWSERHNYALILDVLPYEGTSFVPDLSEKAATLKRFF